MKYPLSGEQQVRLKTNRADQQDRGLENLQESQHLIFGQPSSTLQLPSRTTFCTRGGLDLLLDILLKAKAWDSKGVKEHRVIQKLFVKASPFQPILNKNLSSFTKCCIFSFRTGLLTAGKWFCFFALALFGLLFTFAKQCSLSLSARRDSWKVWANL